MIKNDQFCQPADLGMPNTWRDAVPAAAVRTFPSLGGVSAEAAAAGTKRRSVDGASVRSYTHIGDVVVLEGAFPGTPAWSPPT